MFLNMWRWQVFYIGYIKQTLMRFWHSHSYFYKKLFWKKNLDFRKYDKDWLSTCPSVGDRGPRECCECKDGLWTGRPPGPGDVAQTEEDVPWSSHLLRSCSLRTRSRTAARPWRWCRWSPVSRFLSWTVSSHKQKSGPATIKQPFNEIHSTLVRIAPEVKSSI